MQLGMIGLGRMGSNMTRRLLDGGHQVVVYDPNAPSVQAVASLGALPAASLESLRDQLPAPRIVWMMVPAGEPSAEVIETLHRLLAPDDIIVDGGNSNYKDTLWRSAQLQQAGIHLVDVGTSGGIWGLTEGYSMMVGGSDAAVKRLAPILQTLAPGPDRGWGHVGQSGAGHFAKMVHNGIEYGLMQAYAEGFELLRAKKDFQFDLHQIAEIWRHGSVVRSWLLDLIANALADDPDLADIQGWVADSGEGRWTVAEAIDQDVPAPVITLSLLMRFVSRQDESFAAKLLAALRNQFGGHAVKRQE